MKKLLTKESFGQMMILSFILSETISNFDDLKHKKRKSQNTIKKTFAELLKKTILPENEEFVFDNWDDLSDNFFKSLSDYEIIYICQQTLLKLIRMYDFNSFFYNLFKKIEHNSKVFSKNIDFNFDSFEKALFKITRNKVSLK